MKRLCTLDKKRHGVICGISEVLDPEPVKQDRRCLYANEKKNPDFDCNDCETRRGIWVNGSGRRTTSTPYVIDKDNVMHFTCIH